MSGPVIAADAIAEAEFSVAEPAVLEVTESRASHVGAFPVRRALPRRTRRTVGAFKLVDHDDFNQAVPTPDHFIARKDQRRRRALRW